MMFFKGDLQYCAFSLTSVFILATGAPLTHIRIIYVGTLASKN